MIIAGVWTGVGFSNLKKLPDPDPYPNSKVLKAESESEKVTPATRGTDTNHSTMFTFVIELNLICEQRCSNCKIVPAEFLHLMANYSQPFSKMMKSDHNWYLWYFQNNHIETTKIFSVRSSPDPSIIKKIAVRSSPVQPKLDSVLAHSDPVLICAHLYCWQTEMNGFLFFKSKSNPVFHFKIHAQIQMRKQTILKSKSCLNPISYYFYQSTCNPTQYASRKKFASLFKLTYAVPLFYNTVIVDTPKTST